MYLSEYLFRVQHLSMLNIPCNTIGLLHGYGLIKRGFKSRLGWRPWEPS